MAEVVLVAPQIAANTGAIIRLAANFGFGLHLVEPLGFTLDEPNLRRAGLDYHELARVSVHRSWPALLEELDPTVERLAFSAEAEATLGDIDLPGDSCLVFGCESAGLPAEIKAECRLVRIPMTAGSRSMNLANAVAVASYEAWRQQSFEGSVANPLADPSGFDLIGRTGSAYVETFKP